MSLPPELVGLAGICIRVAVSVQGERVRTGRELAAENLDRLLPPLFALGRDFHAVETTARVSDRLLAAQLTGVAVQMIRDIKQFSPD
jgi:hypothetical protein